MSDSLDDDKIKQIVVKTVSYRKKIKQLLGLASLFFVLLGLVLGVWAFWIEPSRLVIKNVDLSIGKWHQEHNGLRIAILTDLHVGSPHVSLDRLAFIVSETNKQSPDLIMILGDTVVSSPNYKKFGFFAEPDKIAQKLKELKAPLGVIAILGNHDWWLDGTGNTLKTALEQVNINVLKNDSVELTKDGKSFWVAGLMDFWKRDDPPNIIKALAKTSDDPILMLSHNPDIFPEIPDKVSLTLSGHTHGGQIKLPFLGRPSIPSSFGQRYAAGHVIENNRHLYVSTGIGTSIIPVRFCVPPEIVILKIKKE